ncbi:unnamed protein product [Periconia digitata]|uniref:Uncharacterized protein n=1 Tax=Periconia digitata TaxID=1303443 RepID=A0A9W4UUK5_9PLEO|nr:unnamed protein product [Periconia digitata]
MQSVSQSVSQSAIHPFSAQSEERLHICLKQTNQHESHAHVKKDSKNQKKDALDPFVFFRALYPHLPAIHPPITQPSSTFPGAQQNTSVFCSLHVRPPKIPHHHPKNKCRA